MSFMVRLVRRSIDGQPELLDDRRPLALFALDVGRILRRCAGHRTAAIGNDPLLDVVGCDDRAQLLVQPVDDRLGLVDGGVMNNLPVDIMAAEARGPIIAVDVSGEIDLRAFDPLYGERPIWSLIAQRMRGSPSIISILMRAGTVGSNAQRRIVREQADFLYEPPLEGVGMRDWQAFERAIAQGYAHAMLEIEKHGVPLSDSWAAGPALAVSRVPT